MFDPAKLTPSKRALGTFCAIAAGTAAAVTAGPAIAAGVAGVAGLLTNFLASDIQQVWAERAGNPKYSHPNHDLERLVGDAVALVLFGKSREAGSKAEQKKLESIALIASATYVELASKPAFQELTSSNLPELFRQAAERIGEEVPLLTLPVWTEYVTILGSKLKLNFEAQQIAPAAKRLHTRLMPAIREMVKRNFSGDGRAYAALSLDMSATLLKNVVKIQERQTASQVQLQDVIDKLDRIKASQQSALTPVQAQDLKWLVDEFANYCQIWRETQRDAKAGAESARDAVTGIVKVHEQQQFDSERLARIEALLKEQFANKTAGEDPTQTQLPPELIEQAKVLLERGNQEQQALAEIALKNHAAADALIQKLKQNPLAEAFRLLTLEGDNWYQAGEFDRAIEPYEQALALQPKNNNARNNVALALQFARLGNIAQQVERSIALLSQSLEILAQGSPRSEWAMTQNNLGNAWSELPTGDRVANLHKAIDCYEAALTVYSHDAHPVAWAKTQANLGNTWNDLPTGDRSVNLQRTIQSLEASLSVLTRETHSVLWATTQNNLGIAWGNLPTDERDANLLRAIECYEAALTVRKREDHPIDWALTQNNLGNSWQRMPTGDQSENLNRSIMYYEAALTVLTRDAHPMDWAMTQNNLAIAWQSILIGDRAANLDRAIKFYETALTVYSHEAHPVDWAWTQNNLGIALASMAEMVGERKCYWLRRAISSTKKALQIFTPEQFPRDHQGASKNLAIDLATYEAAACHLEIPFDDIPPPE